MDVIKKKLELIDFKLNLGPAYLVRQIIETTSLVLAALAIIIGILLQKQQFINFPALFWLALAIFSSVFAFIYILVKRKESSLYVIICLVFFCFVSVGAIRLISYRNLPANDIINIINERTLATIRGTIISDPRTNDSNDWLFSKFRFTDPTSSFYLEINEAESKEGWLNVSGIVRIQVNEPIPESYLNKDDYVQIYCWLEKVQGATNPGEFDLAEKLAKENIFIAASADSRDAIEVLSHQNKFGFFKLHKFLNKKAELALRGNFYEENEHKDLIEALILGSRYKIDDQTLEAFRTTGLLHFLSLSGLNFVIMIAFIWWLCKFTGLGKKGQAIICIAVSILFVLAVPPNPPVLRAAVISLVFCASYLFRRQPNPFNSIALSAIILLLFRPMDLFDASWQLSFATTSGILLFCGRIKLSIDEKIKTFFNSSGLLSASLAAWLCGAGIMLYHFNTITPLTFIWTVLTSPLVSIIMILGLLKIIFSFLLPSIAFILGIAASLFANCFVWIVKFFAEINFSEIIIGKVSIGLVLFYYCVLFFIAFCFFRRPLIKQTISIVLIAVFAFTISLIKFERTNGNNLVLTCLDIGHGQAIFVQMPGSKTFLFDAGSLYKSNIGKRIILPFLKTQAVEKLDSIIISHGDLDHINGIPEVVNNIMVKSIYANDTFTNGQTLEPSGLLGDYLKNKELGVRKIENLQFKNPAEIKILWPLKESIENELLGDNDKSMVSLIVFGGRKIMFCSDIEKPAQQRILQIYPDLKADVVIAPHHGSTATSDPAFIKRLEPQFLIYSSGPAQYENQSEIKRTAVQLFTARDGAIQMKINKSGKITYKTVLNKK